MTDDLDILRSFRADVSGPDTDTLTRIRDAVAERTSVGSDRDAVDTTPGVEPGLILLEPVDAPSYVDDTDDVVTPIGAGRRRRHLLVGAAATLLLLVGVVAWFASGDDTSDEGFAEPTTPLTPLVPTYVPEGFSLANVTRPDVETAPTAAGPGFWTLYTPDGSVDPDEPTGIMVSAHGPVLEDFRLADRDPGQAVVVDVGTGVGHLYDEGNLATLDAEIDGQRYFFVGRNVAPDVLIRAAAAASTDDDGRGAIPLDALPTGWELHSMHEPDVAEGTLTYLDAANTDTSIVVSWGRGDATTLEASLVLVDDSGVGCGDDRCRAVDGHPTVLGASIMSDRRGDDGQLYLAWFDGERIVSVTGTGVPLGEMYAMAESLEATTWEELEAQIEVDPRDLRAGYCDYVTSEQPESYVGSDVHIADIRDWVEHGPVELQADYATYLAFLEGGGIDPADPDSNLTENFPAEVQAAIGRILDHAEANCP